MKLNYKAIEIYFSPSIDFTNLKLNNSGPGPDKLFIGNNCRLSKCA